MRRSFYVLRANLRRVGYLLSLVASNEQLPVIIREKKQAFFIVSVTRMCMYC